MNKLRSVLKKRRAKEDPRVRRRLFSWRMFAMTLLVVSVLSAGNVFALEKLLKMQVFSVVASMGVGSYWVAMAFLAAIVLHLYTCRRFDRPMRALSRAMRRVTEGDFTVRVKPFHHANKFDYMDIMCEDFNRMVQELEGDEGHMHLDEYADSTTERGQCLLKSICEKLGFDSLGYQSLDGVMEAIGIDPEKVCTYCWNGKE